MPVVVNFVCIFEATSADRVQNVSNKENPQQCDSFRCQAPIFSVPFNF